MRTMLSCLCAMMVLGWSMSIAHTRTLELTFDDAPSGSSEDAKNAEDKRLGPMRLLDGAVRSSVEQGRYGRGLTLVGGASRLELSNAPRSLTIYAISVWVKLDAAAPKTGWLFDINEAAGVRLVQGKLAFSTAQNGQINDDVSAVTLSGGDWHHLYLVFNLQSQRLEMTVDFQPAGLIDLPQLGGPPNPLVLSFGRGLTGVLDDLVVYDNPEDWQFDRDPDACPDGLRCVEEVVMTRPSAWSWDVPVRMKAAWDPNICNANTPCPLLVSVSGGGTCADDYSTVGSVQSHAGAGFVVVTVDPTCELSLRYTLYPVETSQLIAAKTYAFEASSFKSLLQPGSYAATGCSHGANVTTLWSFLEPDHPTRTFARSASMSTACAYQDVFCASNQRLANEVIFEQDVARIGVNSVENQWLWRNWEMLQYMTPEVVAQREFGASWGVDTSPQTPSCNADGSVDCYESAYGFVYAGRRAKALWDVLSSPQRAKTGYFFEYKQEDCQHCNVGAQMRCVNCFLRFGREGMASEPACQGCVEMEDEVPDAEGCGLECTAQGCSFDQNRDDRTSWPDRLMMSVMDPSPDMSSMDMSSDMANDMPRADSPLDMPRSNDMMSSDLSSDLNMQMMPAKTPTASDDGCAVVRGDVPSEVPLPWPFMMVLAWIGWRRRF